MQIRFTEQEKIEFEALSKDEQTELIAKKANHRNNLSLKSIVLTNLLLETLDELEHYNMTRFNLKRTTQKNKVELDKYLDDTFRIITQTGDMEVTEYTSKISEAVDKLFD